MGQAAARRGEDWFTEIYANHYPLLVKYGLRRLADLDASAELAQDVFAIAWRRREQVPDHCLPWLYGVARRLLANHRRAERTRPAAQPISNAEALRDDRTGRPEAAAAFADILAALATLGDLDREILRLIGWEELTVGEAAAVLGCTQAAASVRLHRARRRLTAAMTRTAITTRPTGVPLRAPTRLWKEP